MTSALSTCRFKALRPGRGARSDLGGHESRVTTLTLTPSSRARFATSRKACQGLRAGCVRATHWNTVFPPDSLPHDSPRLASSVAAHGACSKCCRNNDSHATLGGSTVTSSSKRAYMLMPALLINVSCGHIRRRALGSTPDLRLNGQRQLERQQPGPAVRASRAVFRGACLSRGEHQQAPALPADSQLPANTGKPPVMTTTFSRRHPRAWRS